MVPSSDKKEESEETEVEEPVAPAQAPVAQEMTTRQRFERYHAAESVAIKKYLDSIQVPQSERILNAEFSSSFQNIDPIMDRKIVFDAYVKADTRERFIETIRARSSAGMFSDRLYVMLNKIWLYRQAKKAQAELILLIVEIEDDEPLNRLRSSNRLIEFFQPAIANDILRVEFCKISSEEIEIELAGNQQSLL